MRVVIGADHGGFELKEQLKKFLKAGGYEIEDAGSLKMDGNDDYPDFARKVAEAVGKEGREIGQRNVMGILVCRSAAGMVIAANKVRGVRAVAAFDETSAIHSRQHNDANVLALSGDWLEAGAARNVLKAWLEAPYSNEARHTRRLKKILEMEEK